VDRNGAAKKRKKNGWGGVIQEIKRGYQYVETSKVLLNMKETRLEKTPV